MALVFWGIVAAFIICLVISTAIFVKKDVKDEDIDDKDDQDQDK